MLGAPNKSFEYARKKRGRDAQKSRAPQFNRYAQKVSETRLQDKA
jgi:hypothetical protein